MIMQGERFARRGVRSSPA